MEDPDTDSTDKKRRTGVDAEGEHPGAGLLVEPPRCYIIGDPFGGGGIAADESGQQKTAGGLGQLQKAGKRSEQLGKKKGSTAVGQKDGKCHEREEGWNDESGAKRQTTADPHRKFLTLKQKKNADRKAQNCGYETFSTQTINSFLF